MKAPLRDFYPSEYWLHVRRQLDRLEIPEDAKITTPWGELPPRAALNAAANYFSFRIGAADRFGIPADWDRRKRTDLKDLNSIRRSSERLGHSALLKEEATMREKFEQVCAGFEAMLANEPTDTSYIEEIVKWFGLAGRPIGDENGPVISFLTVAARPVLGKRTPTASALRGRLRRS
jgi:hypothetical protein